MERAADQRTAGGPGAAAADGSRQLARGATAWLAGLAFALTFLIATLAGGSGGTALLRGAIAAAATLVLAPLLLRAVLSAVLDAIARDRVRPDVAEKRE